MEKEFSDEIGTAVLGAGTETELPGPVSTMTLADAAEKRICEYIGRKKMRPGSLLPKEEEFSKSMGVSRHIVREALSRLRMIGLIESRKKRGMTLSEPDAFIGLKRMVEMDILDKKHRKELFEMRVILELGITEYVFSRKTDSDIAELEMIAAKDDPERHYLPEMDTVELEFHSKLYRIAGNDTLLGLQGILKPFFGMIERIEKPHSETGIPTHADLCAALKKGTAEKFHKIMREHLRPYIG
jgi:DNA-binding FadR family transcriptional regulator